MKTKTNKDIPEWDLKIKMDPRDKKEWIRALLSGDYGQGHKALYTKGAYCCMGVLCKIRGFSNEELLGFAYPSSVGLDIEDVFNQSVDEDWTLKNKIGKLNDFDGYTFEDLAEVIDHNL